MEKLFIEAISTESMVERNTHTTNFSKSVGHFLEVNEDILEKLKQKIVQVSEAFSETLVADETTVEFSFSVSSEGNIYILSGNSSLGIKVKLKWDHK